MSNIISKRHHNTNNTASPLCAGSSHEGVFQQNINKCPTLQIVVKSDKPCSIRIQQSANASYVIIDDIYYYSPGKANIFQQTLALSSYKLIVTNTSSETMSELYILSDTINHPAIKQGCVS
jgi:hypothetical protein